MLSCADEAAEHDRVGTILDDGLEKPDERIDLRVGFLDQRRCLLDQRREWSIRLPSGCRLDIHGVLVFAVFV